MNETNLKVLELKEITKIFPGVVALDSVNFSLYQGEVHALIGENGAGKSTLVNIIAGVYPHDGGEIFLNGEKTTFLNEKDSINKGIGPVFQERSLIPQMTVADNIFAARQPVNPLGFINNRILTDRVSKILKKLKLNIDPNIIVKNLSSAKQQQIEIAKALSLNAKILILDEVTATITENETRVLFNLIRDLKKEGISIIYISHRLEEIFEIVDRVTVLKDGKLVCTKPVSETNIDELVTSMTGRTIKFELTRYNNSIIREKPILEVSGFSRGDDFKDISFKLFKGEILGFGGLVGAGKTEIVKSLFGVDKYDKGEIFLEGKKIKNKNSAESIKNGFGFVPEDRRDEGLFVNMDIEENIISTNMKAFTKFGFLNYKSISKYVSEYISRFRIVTPSNKQKVANLSGGNQQKIVLSKWFGLDNKILIVDEPTRGIDVGAKSEIYKLLNDKAKSGVSIIIISSEFKELLNFCNRIIVFWNGKIAGEVSAEESSEEELVRLASGL